MPYRVCFSGNVINIHSGQWVGKMSGLGAGLDSFYEYLLKVGLCIGSLWKAYLSNIVTIIIDIIIIIIIVIIIIIIIIIINFKTLTDSFYADIDIVAAE